MQQKIYIYDNLVPVFRQKIYITHNKNTILIYS